MLLDIGIGKSSYVKYIASMLADSYLYNKEKYSDYIPVLVGLKYPDRVYNYDKYVFDITIEQFIGDKKGRIS